MSTVIKLTTPTVWPTQTAHTPATAGGHDICSLFFDRDGTTVWGFQYSGPGFARWNISDGSIVFQGTIFNSSDTTESQFVDSSNYPMMFQDASGNYYVSYSGSLGAHPNHQTLYKINLGTPGTGPNDIFYNYGTTSATLQLDTAVPSSFALNNFPNNNRTVLFVGNDGVTYLAHIGTQYAFVVDLTNFVYKGSYNTGSLSNAGEACFSNSSGILHIVTHLNTGSTSTSHYDFWVWTPTNGATGGLLNSVVQHTITGSLTTTNNDSVVSYISSSQKALIGHCINAPSVGGTNNMEWLLIDLTSFTITSSLAANNTFGYGLASSIWAKVNQQSDNSLATQAVTSTSTPHSQQAGVLSLNDPNALTTTSQADITGAILSAGFTVPFDSTAGAYRNAATWLYRVSDKKLLVNYFNTEGSGGGIFSDAFIVTVAAGGATPKPTVCICVS